ncbi:hypothetical protein JCM19232_4216 [Vibrio ishigakensis]|uniref:Uncharacterized protein n=1 Tax=Vibrio ishigakensis TaxID=1481914 RepID=A0A0B8PFZ8_9VIBR|nr:hypothetical protein JCM19232_4216 [Vibrio ishigakensis]
MVSEANAPLIEHIDLAVNFWGAKLCNLHESVEADTIY